MHSTLYKIFKSKHLDRSLTIWLSLIALTLISAIIAETDTSSIPATIFVCLIIIAKGRWVIDEFMGLKQAEPVTRKVVKSYFYLMTAVVGTTLIYTQSTMTGL